MSHAIFNRQIVLVILIGFIDLSVMLGQGLEDALRYSLNQHTSTARSVGVAGVFNSVGADLSVANINPAGLAEFRRSEYTISVGLGLKSNEGVHAGETTSQSRTDVQLDNLAAVFVYDPPSFDVKSFNLAIGVNKLADFNQDFSYRGQSSGTIVQRFLELSTGRTLDELDNFEGGLAYDAGAVYISDVTGDYETDFQTFSEVVMRSEDIERSGSHQEVYIATATNIKNKFSLGFTLGIPIIRYEENRTYRESDELSSVDFFDRLRFEESLITTGAGVNFKLGLLYKITPKVRFGLAVHSPSWLFLSDEFASAMEYEITSNVTETFNSASPISQFDYRIQTPWRATAGIGHIFRAGDIMGFVSGEVEVVDYTSSSLNLTVNSNNPLDQFFEDDANNDINTQMQRALNFRLGAEIAYKKFRFRLGGSQTGDPFVNSNRATFDPQLSAGLGFRGNNNYIDVGFTRSVLNELYSPYALLNSAGEPIIENKLTRNRISITYGSKF